MEAFNLAAIEFQLSQIAAAAHIAVALNRTLIFPKASWWHGSKVSSPNLTFIWID